MLTFYHSPMSRSSRVLQLIHELGLRDKIRIELVTVPRSNGSGARDPRNPHAEGKVPYLVHDGVGIRESVAIMQYLADLVPGAGQSVPPGHPLRGRYLAWFAWYAGVFEPVIVLHMLGIKDPRLEATFRDLPQAQARVAEALEAGPWLAGEHHTAADLLIASTFTWQPELTPDSAAVRDWLARCTARPALRLTIEDEGRMAADMGLALA